MGTIGMKYSLPSREIIADSYETIVEAHSYDGNISIPGCDKNIPGCLMAMIRINKPSFMIYGGSIMPGNYNNKDIDVVDAFQSYGNFIKDNDEKKRENIIMNACPGSGSCGGMYTANTMAAAFETMGITLPGSSSNPALSKEKFIECEMSNETMYNLLNNNIKPLDIITKKSIENAINVVIALGGSTNSVIHLLAIAKTAGIELNLDDFRRKVPVITNLKPNGDYLMYHLYKIGGVPLVIKILIDNGYIDGTCLTINGKTLGENVAHIKYNNDNISHIIDLDFKKESHLKILKGNLSPLGCVGKISGNEGYYFKGKAKVFESENSFMEYIKDIKNLDNDLNILKKIVFVIRNQGPKGGPGMPEMLKPTSSIIGMGIKDNVAFITDGRFSGGSHGFIIGHVSPEAYDGGPISQLEDGDTITIDAINNSIDVYRKSENLKMIHTNNVENNYLKKYRLLVKGSDLGCITV